MSGFAEVTDRNEDRQRGYALADRLTREVSPQLGCWVRECVFHGAPYDEIREKLETAFSIVSEERK